MPTTSTVRGLAAFALACLAAIPASATTYVMATDDELLDKAPVVVLARVAAIESAPSGDRPATDYLVEIESLIKGFVPASNIIVRVPGGQRADGVAIELIGAPRLASDEQVLLFLRPQSAGTFGIVDLALGAFRRVDVGAQSLVVRDLSANHEAVLAGDRRAAERARSHLPRRLDSFANWLTDRAAGQRRAPDYYDESPELPAKVASAFTLTRSSTQPFPSGCGGSGNNPIRWPEFDLGGRIRVTADANGQPGVPGGGFQEIQDAIAAWNGVPSARVNLLYNGTTTNLVSANQFDDRNLILNEDPFDDIDGSFTGSGTVAVTLAAFDCFAFNTWSNGTAHDMVEADIVFQDGTGNFLFGNSDTPGLDYAEVVAHELGHLIGIAHSCGDSDSPHCGSSKALDDAIMRAIIRGNGRGPTLADDDRSAAQFLYPTSGGGGGGGGGGGQTPAAPSELTAVTQNTSQILLTWKDNSNNETSFEIQERGIEGGFVTIGTVSSNTTSLLVTGIPPGSFRAYRVRARNNNGNSAFSNEANANTFVTPGTCFESASTLCLNGDRFRVRARFETAGGSVDDAMAEPLTDDTGYFWFFDQANVEAVIKVLRGCTINSRFWVFAGGLTDVKVTLTVSDMSNGVTKTYFNPLNTPFEPIQDTSAFATCP
ncbi:MAG TPA: fibronectin type III domain-containing protein [Thermoanaerobaculia bacterium]|nr:fibronectin type III domain-containing protein [Thermoanaerobaculia bacterium]